MKKHHVLVFGILLFLFLMVPMMINNVQAFNKYGPTTIPGNLVPFPGMMHDKNHDLKTPSAVPPAKK